MNITKKLAVVDLETTGTNKKDDKIIQFGCTLIDDGKITKSVSIMINPEQEISERIQKLTHINNDDVKSAPTFNEVAEKIYDLIKGRTFVAHNVNFDFPFLMNELSNNGYENINVSAVDTVELSQILLPQVSSFKLQDIAEFLNIRHSHPHRADDDSNVTAKLMLILIKLVRQMPFQTLKTICRFKDSLIRQTGDVLQEILDSRVDEFAPLPDYLYEKNGLVLRKKMHKVSIQHQPSLSYPKTSIEKENTFNSVISYRKTQVKMMDSIFNASNTTDKSWNIIEAPMGVGKTLGYLFPLSYSIDIKNKLVISTTTTVLQSQIIDEVIPLLNNLRDYNYNVQLIKSSYNYIDLDRFYSSLFYSTTGHKTTSILKMKILLWLTITQTGDLDEIHLTKSKVPYVSTIQHHGETKDNSIFSNEDFWTFSLKAARNSEIIVTNQSFLAANLKSNIWDSCKYLVVDEAHHFSDNLRANNSPTIDLKIIRNELKKISDIFYQNRSFLQKSFSSNYSFKWTHDVLSNFEKLFTDFNDISEQLNHLIFTTYFKQKKKFIDRTDFINTELLYDEIKKESLLISKLIILKNTLTELIVDCDKVISAYFAIDNFQGVQLANIVSNISSYNSKLRVQAINLMDFINDINEKSQKFGLNLRLNSYLNPRDLQIKWYDIDIKEQIDILTTKFKNIFMVSGAINSNDNFAFFIRDLQISESNINTKLILDSQYDISKNAKIFIPNDAINIKDVSDDEYSQYIADTIINILDKQKYQTLVLFNSLSTMKDVFKKLTETDIANEKEILAQGINGSNEKIKKRFMHSKNAILLGSNSFWEGVDFPKKTLEILVMTRLPFDSPDIPETIIRSKYLSKLNLNAFLDDAIPRATIKLRQGFGRLLRTPTDKGVMILLDNRAITSSYGKNLLSYYPKEIIETNLKTSEIKSKVTKFLN